MPNAIHRYRGSSRRTKGFAARRGLGDDVQAGSTLDTAAPVDVQTQMLDALRGVRQDIADRLRREELQKWIQIAATVSIPIAAWAWKQILGRRAAKKVVGQTL